MFKDDLTCQGIDVWKDTKRVAQWMYRNGEKRIDENSLLSVIQTGENFLLSMIQMGFMDCYESDNKKQYYFVIDSLTDFLIARFLYEDIRGKNYEEQISIIKSKVESLYNLEEALIIAIFDNMSPDYEKIKDLLIGIGLIEELDFNILVKVHFKRKNIATFLRCLNLLPIVHYCRRWEDILTNHLIVAITYLILIVQVMKGYVGRLIIEYERSFAFYIQEPIIYVLSQIKKITVKF